MRKSLRARARKAKGGKENVMKSHATVSSGFNRLQCYTRGLAGLKHLTALRHEPVSPLDARPRLGHLSLNATRERKDEHIEKDFDG